MRSKGEWSGIPGHVIIEVDYEPGRGWADLDGRLFPYLVECLLPHPAEEDAGTITIDFTSSGYYDPGKTSGLPENCYPPEGDDERTVEDATFSTIVCDDGHWHDGSPVKLTAAALSELDGMYRDKIEDADDLDWDAHEPDWDSIAEARAESRMMRSYDEPERDSKPRLRC